MAQLFWDSADDVGIASIDAHHRELLGLVDTLAAAEGDGVATALNRLMIFTRMHFDHEEALFHAHDYPDADCHTRRHRYLMLILTRFAESFEATPGAMAPLVAFLRGWLLDHIRSDDRAFADHVLPSDRALPALRA